MVTSSPWFHRLARLGFIAKGVVYALIGGLAIMLVVNGDGKITDKEGALHTIGSQPFGKLFLGLTAIGLFGYAVWRCVQSLLNAEHEPDTLAGWLTRAGYAVSGFFHGALAVLAIQMIDGSSGGGHEKPWLLKLLGSDAGRIAVAIAGLTFIGVGLHGIWKAFTSNLHDRLARDRMTRSQRKWIQRLARLGVAAHGLILGMIGFFLVRAALGEGSIREAGVDGALRALASQPYGSVLLLLVAFGLVAYGGYMFVWARFRRTP